MRENMYTVPVHLLTLLAASSLLCPSTRVRNSTRFTFTPKKASVARPWFTATPYTKKKTHHRQHVDFHY
jgi:hypothetical protein